MKGEGFMKNKAMKKLCMALSMALAITSLPFGQGARMEALAAPQAGVAAGLYENGLAQKVEDGSILHCWCWNFNEIREKLPDIAAAGFSSIQTSPICQVLVGENGGLEIAGQGKWYYHYQPTDYVVGNYQLGTEEEFKAMCREAHKYGIKVIVDSVLNHTTSDYASISDNIKNLEGGAFHRMGDEREEGENWSETDRYEETQYDLSGLYELNTQNKNVQNYILTFLQRCVEDGADGFRYDAAKLIELPDDTSQKHTESFASDFWPTILQNGASFQYGEVLQEGGVHYYQDEDTGEYLTESGYDDNDSSRLAAYQSQTYTYNGDTHYMNTTNSFTGFRVRDAVTGKNVKADFVTDFLLPEGASKDRVVTWVESHDNYCNDATYEELDMQQVIQAWALIAARKGGTPLFFDRPNHSTQEDPWGDNKIGPEGSDMYKDPQVVAVNFFRNEMGDSAETVTNPGGNTQVVMIERGDEEKGCVIVNVSDEYVDIEADTGMADGTYTDQVYGGSFTVSGGKLAGTVEAGKVAVVYNFKIAAENRQAFLPAVSLSVGSGTFLADTLDVTVTVRGCDHAEYTISGNTVSANAVSANTCKNGDVVTISDLKQDESATLLLTGYDSKGDVIASTKETYTRKVSNGTTVYFNKKGRPDWKNVYVYAYYGDGNSAVNNSGWPGRKAEHIGNDIYKYVIPYDMQEHTCQIIFNNNKGDQLHDVEIKPAESMIYTAYGEWKAYSSYADETFVKLSKPTSTFDGTLDITLFAVGCESVAYQLGDAEPKAYKNGDKLTIGEGMEYEQSVTLTVTGIGSDGQRYTDTATYTKHLSKPTVVYFNKQYMTEWTNVYVYVWGAGSVNNAGWPGVKATHVEGDLYKYELPSAFLTIDGNIILNNGSGGEGNQFDAGSISPEQTKLFTADGKWISYDEDAASVALSKDSGEFEDSLSVTFSAEGCELTTYTMDINGETTENEVTDTTITIGRNLSGGDVITIILKGVDIAGRTHTATASYTKKGAQTQNPEQTPTPTPEQTPAQAQTPAEAEKSGRGNNGTKEDQPVEPDKVAVTKITIKGDSGKIAAGKRITLTADVAPDNATNQSIKWSSSNTKYATVNAKGVVTTKKAGAGKTVTITAAARDGSGKKATYKITIMKKAVTKITLKASKKTVKAGARVTIRATVAPKSSANTALIWKSSNTKYATVNKSGVVTTKKAGKGRKVTITAAATDGSGKKATVKIKIK